MTAKSTRKMKNPTVCAVGFSGGPDGSLYELLRKSVDVGEAVGEGMSEISKGISTGMSPVGVQISFR